MISDLIESIRIAVAEGATHEQKATGVHACHTIAAALGVEPGKPIVLPGAPQPHPLSTATLDQALDLLIARLTTIASRNEADVNVAQPALRSSAPRLSFVHPVPTAAVSRAFAGVRDERASPHPTAAAKSQRRDADE